MSVDSRVLLAWIIDRLQTMHPPWSGLWDRGGPQWSSFFGRAVRSCFEELENVDPHWCCIKRSARNAGLLFGHGAQTQVTGAATCTDGDFGVFELDEVLDMPKPRQDVLDFASGFLARRPGPQATAMDEAIDFRSETKAGYLERLLSLSIDFGEEVDEMFDS